MEREREEEREEGEGERDLKKISAKKERSK